MLTTSTMNYANIVKTTTMISLLKVVVTTDCAKGARLDDCHLTVSDFSIKMLHIHSPPISSYSFTIVGRQDFKALWWVKIYVNLCRSSFCPLLGRSKYGFLLPFQMLLFTLNCKLWENFDPILENSLTSCPEDSPLMRGMLWTNKILGVVVLTVVWNSLT